MSGKFEEVSSDEILKNIVLRMGRDISDLRTEIDSKTVDLSFKIDEFRYYKKQCLLKKLFNKNDCPDADYFYKDREVSEILEKMFELKFYIEKSDEVKTGSFMDGIYEILGKDEARTFRSYLRQIVEKIDPVLARTI